ncbi:Ribonuclease [Giardia muris]|uniref:Ribonuclease n=1 Tax=Giardia muris TaxID=5742 RepID=A0A4Z1SVH7_GIAMU|nr:Ribonuclease [Giardia muris]|eukprot:TNJ28915.1 Ribonuclease [Giardia muris]
MLNVVRTELCVSLGTTSAFVALALRSLLAGDSLYDLLLDVDQSLFGRLLFYATLLSALYLLLVTYRKIIFPRLTLLDMFQAFRSDLPTTTRPFIEMAFAVDSRSPWATVSGCALGVLIGHYQILVELLKYRSTSLEMARDALQGFVEPDILARKRRELRGLALEFVRSTVGILFLLVGIIVHLRRIVATGLPVPYRSSFFTALGITVSYVKIVLEICVTMMTKTSGTGKQPSILLTKSLIGFGLDFVEFGIIFYAWAQSASQTFLSQPLRELFRLKQENIDRIHREQPTVYLTFFELFRLTNHAHKLSESFLKVRRALKLIRRFNALTRPSFEEVYGKSEAEVRAEPDEPESIERCSICMDSLSLLGKGASKNPPRRLPCRHLFHDDCIRSWVVVGNSLCPLCNRDIFSTQTPLELTPIPQDQNQAGDDEAAAAVAAFQEHEAPINPEEPANAEPELLFSIPIYAKSRTFSWETATSDDLRECVAESLSVFWARLGGFTEIRNKAEEVGMYVLEKNVSE